MSKMFAHAQKLGKSFMLPIAVLPAAGLLLGIGGALSNPNTVATYPILNIPLLQAVFVVMANAGEIVFANLGVIFAVGIAIGLAKTDKGTAGLASLIGYLVMNATVRAILIITGTLAKTGLSAVGQGMILGVQTLETGVFGGIICGIMAALLHNRYNKIELPQFLGFFGGSRFVPIVTAFAAVILGVVMYFIWPPVQHAILNAGGIVDKTGYVGTLFYGTFLRLLGPFGLHHIFYLPFWTTGLGGSEVIAGKLVEGTQKIFFAQLADPSTVKYYVGTSRFMSGRFITMMFGLPGAALAIYHCAKSENKAKIAGLIFSAALTSFMTGITEPLEFMFLFIAPFLYVVHAVFDGLAFMLAHMFQITIGQTFSGGCIDFILFGILQGETKTNWMYVPVIGACWFALYYFTFRFLIVRFNIMTPGREDEDEIEAVENVKGSARAEMIISALGGKANIKEADCCATRLRITVASSGKIDQALLSRSGARGVIIKGNGVQVVYGPHVTIIKNEIEELLEAGK
ncbi:MAG: PTS transporter subunit EIIC [Negativicutes bacterium]